MSVIIGLTGPTGAGKSQAAGLACDFGFKVIDCDLVARAAVEPDTAGLKALVKVFGKGILQENGGLDRKALAAVAFSSPENTELLNKTLLPHIVDMIRPQLCGNVLLDAPTLFESGLNSVCSKTVAILAERDIRISRIIERDGITINEAELRINAGKPDEFYLKNADYVLYNNGDAKAFLAEVSDLWRSLK